MKEPSTPETSTRFGQNLHSCKWQPSTRKQTNLDFDLVATKHKKITKPKLELEKSVISQFCQSVKKECMTYLSICHFWRALDPSSQGAPYRHRKIWYFQRCGQELGTSQVFTLFLVLFMAHFEL